MRKTLIIIFTLCFLFSVNVYANETDISTNETEKESVAASTSFSTTVTDRNNNRYRVTGNIAVSGKTVTVSTSYQVAYIGDGLSLDTVNGYTKYLSAVGNVSMLGGATNTVNTGSVARTGNSNSCSASTNFLYTITSVVGTHTFSCNGGSTTGYTYW